MNLGDQSLCTLNASKKGGFAPQSRTPKPSAYGRPCWLKVDSSRANLGETLRRALAADGTQVLDVLGQAHEQVGRVEVHGRYFEDMLARVLAQIRPSSRAEWLECIHQTMDAQNSFAKRCGYSPFQIAIGVVLSFQEIFSRTSRMSSARLQFSVTMRRHTQLVSEPMQDWQ